MNIVRAGIAGTGKCIPERILANHELAQMVDTSDEWITTRSGIKERRIADAATASSDLAIVAGRKALVEAKIAPEDVQLIIVATSTPDYLFPTTACLVQRGLGCFNAGAFDLLSACTGFIYALNTGWQFVASGRYSNVLVIGVETLSKIANYKDRSTCVLFGDAAGAVVLTEGNGSEMLYCKLGADGRYEDLIKLSGGGSRNPATAETVAKGMHFLTMKGKEVYKFAVSKMIELTQDAMEQCNLSVEDIGLLIPHQVNMRIIESAAEKLSIPKEKILINIDRYGNTSAASIPVALDEASKAGRLKRGDIVVMVAFGAGLTWGSTVVRW